MRGITLFCLLSLLCASLNAQTKLIYTIKADTVQLIYCDSTELVIGNHSQAIPGFLFNTGNGRTVFKRGAQKIAPNAYLVGADTIYTAANAWVQGGNSFDSTGALGTLDNNNLDFYTNSNPVARLTNTGSFLVGGTADNGDILQVFGDMTVGGQIYSPGGGNPAHGIRFSSTLNATSVSSTLSALEISPIFNDNGYGGVTTFGLNVITGDAQFANSLILNSDGSSARFYSPNPIEYQSNWWSGGIQHWFHNAVSSASDWSGTQVKISGNGVSTSATMLQVLGTNDTAIIDAQASGSVGIGTNSPTAQLHTTGTVRFAGLTEDDTQNQVIVSDASGNLYYRSASSLAADGLVRSSLAVNGPIKAKRLTVSPDWWADYVFDSSYKLTPLAEVDAYVRKEHHLPGIPSAGEVKKDGLDVGAGEATLLKKLEELTLYTIDQDKRLTSQRTEIDELKSEVEALKKLVLGNLHH